MLFFPSPRLFATSQPLPQPLLQWYQWLARLLRRTKKHKLDMIATLVRSGSGTGRRVVGPAAADKLLRILTATDPDMPIQTCA